MKQPLFLTVLLTSFVLAGCGKSSAPKPVAQEQQKSTEVAASSEPTPQSPLPKYLQEAVRLISIKEFTKAEQELTRLLVDHADDSQVYALRAGLFASSGRGKEALTDLNRAIELAPKNTDHLYARGLLYLTARMLNQAVQDFQSVVQLKPDHPQAANNLALIYVTQGDYDRGIREFDQILKRDSKRGDVLNNRGLAHWKAGHFELALADFNSALQLNPKNVNTLSNRGQLYYSQARFDEAVSDFTSATAYDPYNLTHFQNRQMAYLKKGRLVEAEENGKRIVWLRKLFQLQREHQKHPESADLRIQLARHFMEGKEFDKAALFLDDLLSRNSKLIPALLGRAELRTQQQQWAKVIEDCSAVLAQEDSFDARSLRGDAYFQLRKLDEAIADYEASQRFDAQVADAYYQRSRKRQSAGDPAGAKADLAHAQELNPKLSTAASGD
ncbi:MAG: tetratricopeptide repeat protein [Planctomycetales bacterium]